MKIKENQEELAFVQYRKEEKNVAIIEQGTASPCTGQTLGPWISINDLIRGPENQHWHCKLKQILN